MVLLSKIPLLVVDDQLGHRRDMAAVLKREGYDVVEADSAASAIGAIQSIHTLRLVFHDLDLGGGSSAKNVHCAVGGLIRERGGLFVVITTSNLTANPGKLRAEYFTEAGVPIFSRPPIPWDDILPLFEAVRSSSVRQTA